MQQIELINLLAVLIVCPIAEGMQSLFGSSDRRPNLFTELTSLMHLMHVCNYTVPWL
jgi:hypothetical protein